MKISLPSLQVAVVSMLASTLHAADPVLTTVGTATWLTEATATGSRTVFTLSKNTVLNWDQLSLAKGSELVFHFVGGKSVVNFLGGTGTHVLDGAVTSNGIVAFFSPTADLEINGSIIAKGVTLATLNSDAADFADDNGYHLSGPDGFNYLTVNGRVDATGGDVVLAGERVIIGDAARIQASQAVLIGGGRDISVAGSGGRTLTENSGLGFVLNLGEARASRIEVAAGRDINNQGRMDAANGRIFLAVGSGGRITNESSGIIIGNAVFDGTYDAHGVVLVPDEGDVVPPVSEGTLSIPTLLRPDGTTVSSGQTLTHSVPTSASSDAARDSSRSPQTISSSMALSTSGEAVRGASQPARMANRPVKSSGKSLLQRSSFFGMRGGNSSKP